MKNEIKPSIDPKTLVKVQFCIPPLGTKIVLAEPWTFDLFVESRNDKLIDSLGFRIKKPNAKYSWDREWTIPEPAYGEPIPNITLPAGSKLTISRIYIRHGKSAYDSVTFSLLKSKTFNGHGRFWAKLYDVNKIVCYPVGVDVDVDRTFDAFNYDRKYKLLDIGDEI